MTLVESIVALSEAYARVLTQDRALSYYSQDELLKAINRLAKEISPEPPKDAK
jgi:hypothetical protein